MSLNKNRIVCVALLGAIIALGACAYIIWESRWQIPVQEPVREEPPIQKRLAADVPEPCTVPDNSVVTPSMLSDAAPMPELTVTPQKAERPSRRTRRRKKKKSKTETTPKIITDKATPPSIPAPTPVEVTALLPMGTETPQTTATTLTIINDIDLKDLAVKHWTGTYTPTKLAITINGIPFTIIGDTTEPVAHGAHKEVPNLENRLAINYVYEFLNGVRKGADTVNYAVQRTTQPLKIRFSWDTPWHVELDGAERTQ